MGLLQTGRFLVLAVATLGGCLVIGMAWLAIGMLLVAAFGSQSLVATAGTIILTLLAGMAMLWFIWWLVMRLRPRIDQAVDDAIQSVVDRVTETAEDDEPSADQR